MAEKMDITKKKCTTPLFRASYCAVFEPKAFKDQEPKYSLTMLFEKSEDLKELKRAAHNAKIEKWGPKEKWPKNLKSPFRDGDADKPDSPEYADKIFVSARSKEAPQVVDRNPKIRLLTTEDFYSGFFARATLIAFAYDTAGNKGVSFALQNVQKWKDGPKLSGRKDASEEFESLENEDDGSENAENYEETDADLDI